MNVWGAPMQRHVTGDIPCSAQKESVKGEWLEGGI